jgi:hypothetical protein
VSNIIDLAQRREERQPHVVGEAFCMGCNHTWTGTWPAGVVDLECPECHAKRGRSTYDVAPPKGTRAWTCTHCENQLFHCLEDRVHCPGCGMQWNYEDMIP